MSEKKRKKVLFSDSNCGHLHVNAGSKGKGGEKGLGRTKGSDIISLKDYTVVLDRVCCMSSQNSNCGSD